MNDLIEQKIIEQAKRRVGFRIHFAVYLIVIIINWLIWAVTFPSWGITLSNYDNTKLLLIKWLLIWPIYPTIGWGIGIIIHYLTAFHADKLFSVDKEIERIKKSN